MSFFCKSLFNLSLIIFILTVHLQNCHSQEYTIYFKLKSARCKAFAVTDKENESILGIINENDKYYYIEAGIDAMSKITDLKFNRSESMILIESSGEGHQYISIYRTDTLLAYVFGMGKQAPSLCILDPYPYWIENINWNNDSTISFSGYSDFSVIDSSMNRPAYNPDLNDTIAKRWLWYPEKRQFMPYTNK